jgi:hypothetical protein
LAVGATKSLIFFLKLFCIGGNGVVH